MNEVINFKKVSKKFGDNYVLKNLTFTIHDGEFVSIVGPSGAGKSTVLNIMGLLESYNSGEVSLLGDKVPRADSRKATFLRRNTINYLFQSFALIEDRTVKDNLLLAMHFVKHSEKIDRIKEILKMVDLADKFNSVVSTLSGGEKQRVALARTLLKPGDIILADEPTGALDPALSETAFNLIKELQAKYKKTIVMVTHNMEQAQQTDRIIEINKP
ncbi:MAG: ABC transporter ATP-binding protein [Lactobacillaceae bacterium]|jgi:putative ABC transport system ATP-binding protein|nr:ABC transporter ATP-binding protein [Lactobacillaceae bacterium]